VGGEPHLATMDDFKPELLRALLDWVRDASLPMCPPRLTYVL